MHGFERSEPEGVPDTRSGESHKNSQYCTI